MRRRFYTTLAAIFPVFFLLHWNGMFSGSYHWALEAVGGTSSFLPQFGFALISAVVIFGAIALLFELYWTVSGRHRAGSRL